MIRAAWQVVVAAAAALGFRVTERRQPDLTHDNAFLTAREHVQAAGLIAAINNKLAATVDARANERLRVLH